MSCETHFDDNIIVLKAWEFEKTDKLHIFFYSKQYDLIRNLYQTKI